MRWFSLILIIFFQLSAIAFDPAEMVESYSAPPTSCSLEEVDESSSGEQFEDCSTGLKEAQNAHQEAVKIVGKANTMLTKKANDTVKAAYWRYFGIDISDPSMKDYIKHVKEMISAQAKKVSATKYECHDGRVGFWCIGDPLAIVPPPKTKIHLCPSFFKQSSRLQTGTLLHEWQHRWGGRHIDYLPETYCWEIKKLTPKKRIRQADAYMQFMYYLANDGLELECF